MDDGVVSDMERERRLEVGVDGGKGRVGWIIV